MTAKIPSTREFIFPSPHEGSGRRFQRRVMNQISEIPEARRATQSRYKFRAGFAALVFLLLIFASPTLAAEPNFPPLTGRVVDDAGILNASTQSRLTDMLAAHERATGEQVVVVTLPSLQGYTIEDYGYQLGRYWGIGQKGKNTGAILIVAPSEHKVRIEVGYGLEGTLTDAICSTIIQNYILPSFKRGDFNAGVIAGTRSILAVLGGEPAPANVRAHTSSLVVFLPFLVMLLIQIIIAVAQSSVPRPPRAAYSPDYDGAYWGPGVSGQGPGGWGGGGFYGGGGGGGGFSGGGGSFGGGGASGSW